MTTRKSSAYNYLKDAILGNHFKPGQPLIEAEIADELNMSRTPVREAIRELSREGLVEGNVFEHQTQNQGEETQIGPFEWMHQQGDVLSEVDPNLFRNFGEDKNSTYDHLNAGDNDKGNNGNNGGSGGNGGGNGGN